MLNKIDVDQPPPTKRQCVDGTSVVSAAGEYISQ